MSGKIQEMKDAVMKGQGGGLQETSQVAGELIGESTDMRGGSSKKADEATTSLGQFSKGSAGPTTQDAPVKASDQVANMETGSADHLDLGFKKT